MGMYDESWCSSCGAGMHYTADETAVCGECAHNEILGYIKQRKEELEADYDMTTEVDMAHYYEGGIEVLDEILTKFGGY